MGRGTRALCPVENKPTTHRARERWWTKRGCRCGQRGFYSTTPRQVGGCGSETPYRKLPNSMARSARASPRGEPADRPQSTCALADLAWLSSQPTRGALHPMPLAQALLQRHCARSAAAASIRRGHSFRSPCRAVRVGFGPWRTGRPPTEHALAGGLGMVVFAANAGRAPSHAIGRGSSSATLR